MHAHAQAHAQSPKVTRSLNHGQRRVVLVLLALATALLVEGWATRQARACGEPEIDYGPDKVVTQRAQGRTALHLNFRRHDFAFPGGNLNFSEVRVYTRDMRLAAWLKKNGMGAQMWQQLKQVGVKTTCAALLDGRSIARLERRLAVAVANAYRQATRRHTPRPDLMLVSGVLDQSEPTCRPKAP